ncbi:hypothetical protein [Allosalinactinospora lopnorensis]|uniref:hypothetical protein n=1 Tax=Allosalinactinospora lopnorensis TaxID=1352348 RepID=UPI0012E0CD68|nr:hypothetical protein [Allosalinactinospora lopnorensis]
MAHVETIMVSTESGEAVALMTHFSSSVHSEERSVTEIRIEGLVLDVEPFDMYDGFSTAVDVYGTSPENAKSNARYIFDLLSRETKWRIALGFDENDNPILERPEIRTTDG